METVLVGMSGGVDSTATVRLLQKEGYDVRGLTLWLCGDESSLSGARKAAEELAIPHSVLDLREMFYEKVEAPFCRAYQEGKTPNPCVLCNASIKISALFEAAQAVGIPYIATGHYAAISPSPTGPLFALGADPKKDQTYFLAGVSKEILPHLLLPLGAYTKAEVREIAAAAALSASEKADSQEICFIPGNDYAAYLEKTVPGIGKEGRILDENGYTVGFHSGTHRFTVGQRKGLGAFGKKVFVTGIDSLQNTVTIGENSHLFSSGLLASNLNIFSDIEGEVSVKIRSAAPLAAAVCALEGDVATIRFREMQRAITPGQTVAIYKERFLVGGGTITAAL